jgi:hypothetical protein
VKYRFINEHRHEYKVATMCRVLKVARAGYYAWLHQPDSNRAIEDKRLLDLIRDSYVASGGVYHLDMPSPCGYPSQVNVDNHRTYAAQTCLCPLKPCVPTTNPSLTKPASKPTSALTCLASLRAVTCGRAT